jgi:hypothetical protein
MQPLTLTDAQLQILAAADCRVVLVDSQGRTVGTTVPLLFSADEIAAAKRGLASEEPEYSVAEKNRLLEEIMSQFEDAGDAV